MKRCKFIIGIILMLCVLVTGITLQFSLAYGQTSTNQQNIAIRIMDSLVQQGIPIKSVALNSETGLNPPTIIDFVIQSQSENDKTAPGEIIYLNIIGRAVNLATGQGLDVGGVGCSIVNINGNVICRVVDAVKNKENIPTDFNPPYILEDDNVSALISARDTYNKMYPISAKLMKDENGFRGITLNYTITDKEIINQELSDFINLLRANFLDLNSSQKTQIASYQINLNCASGEPLLIYINDLLMSRETWWQSEALTCKLNHPGPPAK